MNKYIKPNLSFLVLLLSLPHVNGQVDSIASKFNKFYSLNPGEEIFIHTDRDEYIAGEDIWFNVYLVDKKSGSPSGRSRIAYVELLNPEYNPVIQKKIRLDNGFGPGQFTMPDSLSPGTYTLRAYTNWMKNFLPLNCFLKNIDIFNPFSNNDFKERLLYGKIYPDKINIEYYPEGGTLIYGTPCRIGVKVFDEYGHGLEISGKIADAKADSITSFKTDRYGIGFFNITLAPGENRYRISINNNSENFTSYLPVFQETGIALSLDYTNKETIEISLNTNSRFRSENDTVILFIQTRGNIDRLSVIDLAGPLTKIIIPRADLSYGINQIAIFDENFRPMCERLVYSPPDDESLITVSSPDSSTTRSKIVVEIAIDKKIGSLNNTNLSLSVAPKTYVHRNADINEFILSGTEFDNPSKFCLSGMKLTDIQPESLDNYLIAAKSTRIDWKAILSGEIPVYKNNFEETEYFLKGQLINNGPAESDSGKLLFLSSPGKEAIFQYAITDSKGYFEFLVQIDGLQNDLIIQPEQIAQNSIIRLESSFAERYLRSKILNDKEKKLLPDFLSKWSINYQVGKIYHNSFFGNPLASPLQQPGPTRFYGKPDLQLILADFINLPSMEEVFFELLPGVRMEPERSNYHISFINTVTKEAYKEPVLMIDGVIINDPSIIAGLDPEKVEKIDVIIEDYIVGDYVLYGMLNVITKDGNFGSVTLPRYAARLSSRVYDQAVTFITPDYSSVEMKQSRKPDFRNTLYWKPDIKPDSNGKAVIEFWSSDFASDYEINVQGITGDGKMISLKKTVKVK